MAYKRKDMIILIGVFWVATLIPLSSAADCFGKPFRCQDPAHFIICVDLGNGVSSSIDSFVVPCPAGTECRETNNFECEVPPPTTQASPPSAVTNATVTVLDTSTTEVSPTTTESFLSYQPEIATENPIWDTNVATTEQTLTTSVRIEVNTPVTNVQNENVSVQTNSENYGGNKEEVISETMFPSTAATTTTRAVEVSVNNQVDVITPRNGEHSLANEHSHSLLISTKGTTELAYDNYFTVTEKIASTLPGDFRIDVLPELTTQSTLTTTDAVENILDLNTENSTTILQENHISTDFVEPTTTEIFVTDYVGSLEKFTTEGLLNENKTYINTGQTTEDYFDATTQPPRIEVIENQLKQVYNKTVNQVVSNLNNETEGTTIKPKPLLDNNSSLNEQFQTNTFGGITNINSLANQTVIETSLNIEENEKTDTATLNKDLLLAEANSQASLTEPSFVDIVTESLNNTRITYEYNTERYEIPVTTGISDGSENQFINQMKNEKNTLSINSTTSTQAEPIYNSSTVNSDKIKDSINEKIVSYSLNTTSNRVPEENYQDTIPSSNNQAEILAVKTDKNSTELKYTLELNTTKSADNFNTSEKSVADLILDQGRVESKDKNETLLITYAKEIQVGPVNNSSTVQSATTELPKTALVSTSENTATPWVTEENNDILTSLNKEVVISLKNTNNRNVTEINVTLESKTLKAAEKLNGTESPDITLPDNILDQGRVSSKQVQSEDKNKTLLVNNAKEIQVESVNNSSTVQSETTELSKTALVSTSEITATPWVPEEKQQDTLTSLNNKVVIALENTTNRNVTETNVTLESETLKAAEKPYGNRSPDNTLPDIILDQGRDSSKQAQSDDKNKTLITYAKEIQVESVNNFSTVESGTTELPKTALVSTSENTATPWVPEEKQQDTLTYLNNAVVIALEKTTDRNFTETNVTLESETSKAADKPNGPESPDITLPDIVIDQGRDFEKPVQEEYQNESFLFDNFTTDIQVQSSNYSSTEKPVDIITTTKKDKNNSTIFILGKHNNDNQQSLNQQVVVDNTDKVITEIKFTEVLKSTTNQSENSYVHPETGLGVSSGLETSSTDILTTLSPDSVLVNATNLKTKEPQKLSENITESLTTNVSESQSVTKNDDDVMVLPSSSSSIGIEQNTGIKNTFDKVKTINHTEETIQTLTESNQKNVIMKISNTSEDALINVVSVILEPINIRSDNLNTSISNVISHEPKLIAVPVKDAIKTDGLNINLLSNNVPTLESINTLNKVTPRSYNENQQLLPTSNTLAETVNEAETIRKQNNLEVKTEEAMKNSAMVNDLPSKTVIVNKENVSSITQNEHNSVSLIDYSNATKALSSVVNESIQGKGNTNVDISNANLNTDHAVVNSSNNGILYSANINKPPSDTKVNSAPKPQEYNSASNPISALDDSTKLHNISYSTNIGKLPAETIVNHSTKVQDYNSPSNPISALDDSTKIHNISYSTNIEKTPAETIVNPSTKVQEYTSASNPISALDDSTKSKLNLKNTNEGAEDLDIVIQNSNHTISDTIPIHGQNTYLLNNTVINIESSNVNNLYNQVHVSKMPNRNANDGLKIPKTITEDIINVKETFYLTPSVTPIISNQNTANVGFVPNRDVLKNTNLEVAKISKNEPVSFTEKPLHTVAGLSEKTHKEEKHHHHHSHGHANARNNTSKIDSQKIPSVIIHKPVNISLFNGSLIRSAEAKPSIDCKILNRGRYSDTTDCRKFYICIGTRGPIQGMCPYGTVFSEIKKQCTRNLSHCIRENKFQCVTSGRFSDHFSDDVYYICVQNSFGQFVRFKLQCASDYYLNKNTIKCTPKTTIESQSASSDDISLKSDLIQVSNDFNKSSESDGEFKCLKEGRFAISGECRKYYECYKKHSKLRKRKRKCDSDELFHKDKKKCVDAESYECVNSK